MWRSVTFACFALLLLTSVDTTQGRYLKKKDPSLYCASCRALVSEIKVGLGLTSHIKKHLIGQEGREHDYTKSDARILDVMENICARMTHYVLDSESGQDTFVRQGDSRDVKARTLSARASNSLGSSKLELTCDHLISLHEEDIEEVMFGPEDGLDQKICVDLASACDSIKTEL